MLRQIVVDAGYKVPAAAESLPLGRCPRVRLSGHDHDQRIIVSGHPQHFRRLMPDAVQHFVPWDSAIADGSAGSVTWAHAGGDKVCDQKVEPGQESECGSRSAIQALERAIIRRQSIEEMDVGGSDRRSREIVQKMLREDDSKDAIEAARLQAALDVDGGELRTAGWTQSADRPLQEICEQLRGLPLAAVLTTDISRDGMLQGPNFELAAFLGRSTDSGAILSGGVGSLGDIRRARHFPEICGVIVGKALYDGQVDLAEALELCAEATA